MEYLKGHLPLEEQAQQLLDRGLLADKEELIKRLSAVNYYRLSGYLYPFREPGSDAFRANTRLKTVWDRYCFDRRLRVLLLDAIERVEVAVRTQLIYHFSQAHGAFGHCCEENLPGLPHKNKHPEWHLENENGKKLIINNRCGMVLIICHQFLKRISPTSQWQQRVNQLFAEYPEIPLGDMGLPADWQIHPLWKS